jgi:aldehyde decarbonylase
LKIKVVDGSSLAVAVVLNSIPKGTTQVLLTGKLTKVAYALAFSLCQRNIQVCIDQLLLDFYSYMFYNLMSYWVR